MTHAEKMAVYDRACFAMKMYDEADDEIVDAADEMYEALVSITTHFEELIAEEG